MVKFAVGKFLWATTPLRVPYDVMVQPKDRGGLGLQDPTRKARVMLAARWESSARADTPTLSGCWLRHLQQRYADSVKVPACVKHYSAACRSAAFAGVPDLVGRELNKALYDAALAEDVPLPRAMRGVSPAVQRDVWSSVHIKTLPVDARATWFKVVHDVLPTAMRLMAANQATIPDCSKCGEAEDVTHRLARCGDGRRAAWAWLVRHVKDTTGEMVTEASITKPATMAAAATWTLGVAVHFLATRRNIGAGDLRRYLERRRREEF